MITYIESSSNAIFKNTKKLLNSKDRKKSKLFITEGYRSVSDACSNGAAVEYIVVSESYSKECFEEQYKVYRMADKLFNEISSTVNSQGIIAVVHFVDRDETELDTDAVYNVLYLDCVMDPGNMGTILRTSDAMGVDAVVLAKGCVDIYNPKVVRSTMASIFNVPLYIEKDNCSILDRLCKSGFTVTGTFIDGAVPSYSADYGEKSVIVMGNEANGISCEVAKRCDLRITVPMNGGAESLNVAVCCGMILYEKMCRKKTGGI